MFWALGSVNSNLIRSDYKTYENVPFKTNCLPVVCYNLPQDIEDGHIEQVEHQSRLAVLLPEVLPHSVCLLNQYTLQSLLPKPKVLQCFKSVSSLGLPTLTIIEQEAMFFPQHPFQGVKSSWNSMASLSAHLYIQTNVFGRPADTS